MLYPTYDLYSHELNNDELLSTILVYEFEHKTQKGWLCVIMISLSQSVFIGSKVQ
jgi:hypothetical protein